MPPKTHKKGPTASASPAPQPTSAVSRRALIGSGLSAIVATTVGLPTPSLAQHSAWGLRAPSGTNARSIHSGHSLTDSYIHTGPWPGTIRLLAESLGIDDVDTKFVKSTIPGSPLAWRWRNSAGDLRPTDPTADARWHIRDFDTLVITEGGPPPRVARPSDAPGMNDALDYLCRFAANALENGNGGEGAQDIILWSIWPSLAMWRPDPPNWTESWQEFDNFRAALPEYGRSFQFIAQYATWKLRPFYPNLPDIWQVWVFPGHLWMARLWDDLSAGTVPDLARMQDLFRDDIHTNDIGGYGLACLMLTALYQRDLRTQSQLYRLPEVSSNLQDYFTQIAWEITTTYAPAGMGGQEARDAIWDPDEMEDPLPNWTPAAAR